jgi:DNA/RNA-binding domain of Phe-tRNA-synthetase-like protein
MYFRHADSIWETFPELAAGTLYATGVDAVRAPQLARYFATADTRLDGRMESDLPEIQAWRRTFSRMELKPTQYRCAAESLLRRYRKEGALPAIHPIIDLCNAVSLAFALPIAVFDLDHITGGIDVRHAKGDERFDTFGGEMEYPDVGEVVFVDEANAAHARRWSHRQSGSSSIRPETAKILIVSEALHETAPADLVRLIDSLAIELVSIGATVLGRDLLSADRRRFVLNDEA